MKVDGEMRDKIIAQLADSESRRILGSVLQESKTAISIGKEMDIPPSTLYRKISELKECGLLLIDNFLVRPDGKREARYACTFSDIVFKAKDREIELEVTPSGKSQEKRWFELFFSRQRAPSDYPERS